MKRKVIAVLMIVVLLAISGCSSQPNGSSETEGIDKEMVVALTQVAANLDQQTSLSEIDSQYYSQIYDTLIRKNENKEFEGALAETFTVSEDNLEIEIKLREGVKFSNGNELKAKDIAYTVERGKEKSGSAQYMAKAISEVEVIDDYNLIIRIDEPNATIFEILSALFIYNEEATEAAGDQYGLGIETVTGCGAYIISEWETGGDMTLVANKEYYSGEPDIKKIKMISITDPTAAVVALQTGEIDLYMSDIPGNDVETIKNSDGLTLTTVPSNLLNYLVFNVKDGMFTDLKMRQAVAYAINRDDALVVGTEGYGNITNSVANAAFTGNPEVDKWYSQDIEKAKELVKEAGKEGAEVTLYTLSFDPYIQLATMVQNQLSQIGLNVNIQQLENNAFIDQLFAKSEFEIAVTFWTSDIKDFDMQASSLLHTDFMGYSGNISLYSNPEMDKLIEDGRKTYDIEERKIIYAEAMRIMYNDLPLIPLHTGAGSRGYSSDLEINPEMLQYRYLKNFSWAN